MRYTKLTCVRATLNRRSIELALTVWCAVLNVVSVIIMELSKFDFQLRDLGVRRIPCVIRQSLIKKRRGWLRFVLITFQFLGNSIYLLMVWFTLIIYASVITLITKHCMLLVKTKKKKNLSLQFRCNYATILMKIAWLLIWWNGTLCAFMCLGKDAGNGTFTTKDLVIQSCKEQKVFGLL